jgi:hypothetical protein
MIFARYIGPPTEGWTPGKIYYASEETAVDIEEVRLQDDTGEWREIKTADGLLEFPKEIFAACVKPIMNLRAGQVVQVHDVSLDSILISTDGYLSNYLNFFHFEILDRTNVTLGNKVKWNDTGCWHTITRLDNQLYIGVDFSPVDFLPLKFTFPVGNGDILSEPMLKCVSEHEGELTVGKLYSPLKEWDELVEVINDAGKVCSYMTERFSLDLAKVES